MERNTFPKKGYKKDKNQWFKWKFNIKKKNIFPYLLIAPTTILMIVLIVYPIYIDFKLSLFETSIIKSDVFVGFQNYINVLTDPDTFKIAKNTFIWIVGSVVLDLIIGLIIALLLNKNFKGFWIFQFILIILPWATPDVVAAGAWKWMYNSEYGIINEVLTQLGIIDTYKAWLGSTTTSLGSVIVANVWKGYPISAMMYLAGLKAIPDSYYEAASIDGANQIQKFFFITLPNLKNIIVIVFLMTIIWTVNYFPLIYIMTGGGPANSSDIFVTNIYRYAFKLNQYGVASTLAIMMFIITLIFTLFYIKRMGVKGK